MTFGSLFAGIGGFDLGLERCGMQCKWQVEIDDYATKILERHWPGVHRERDIKQCGRHNLERVDVICGGFPCQDISYAGKGAGLDGERSGLFFEAIRVVRELRPRAVVLENVAGLLTRGLDRVLGTLAEVGYDSEWHCISAAAVGAPHVRQRVFIFAYRGCKGREGLEQGENIGIFRPWGWCSEKDLQLIAENPHEPGNRWPKPIVRRMDDGIPCRVDRLRCLGNAIVPQVAEVVGRLIVNRLSN